jgi:GT2 family glycosyltransferase
MARGTARRTGDDLQLNYPGPVTSAARHPSATMPPLDALSVVIPVYNEETWIRSCLAALIAAGTAAQLPLDVVVVDDGSTDRTPEVLAELAAQHGIRVVTQPNAGRLAARRAGLAQTREQWVLLLDSRVITDRNALAWVRKDIAEHRDRTVWCGHVDVETDGNLFAAFWSGLVKIGWRRYTSDPRLVSFDAEDFDAFPKGTTCLLMPRTLLDEAVQEFRSLFDNADLSSDDTRLLRYVAGRTRIWLTPDFRFLYHGKEGARRFVKQAYFRGTTFVDGYLGQPGPVRRALLAAIGTGGILAVASLRRPAVAALGMGAVTAAAPAVVSLAGGSRDEARAAALLSPVFVIVFGSGVLRGLALAAARLWRRRPPVTSA